MSRVNDALKRAQQAQRENPPPTPPLQFRPVDPAQETPARSPLLFVGLALALILLIGLVGLAAWIVGPRRQAELRVAAKPAAPAAGSPALSQTPAGATNPPVALRPPLIDLGQPDTNTAIVAAPAEPPTPALKLQGIVFHPSKTLAVINGRTVGLGERVNGFRVVAITPHAVTLASATATNVLSLSD